MVELWFEEGAEELPEPVAEARAACEEQATAVGEAEASLAEAEEAHAAAEAAAAEAQEGVDALTAQLEAEQAAVDECPSKEDLEAALEEATAAQEEASGAAGEAEPGDSGAVEEAQGALDEAAGAVEEAGAAVEEAQGALDGFEPEEGEEGEIVNQEDQDGLQAALDEATAAQEEAQAAADEAQGALDEATAAFDEANAAFEEAQGPLAEATAAVEAAQEAVDSCPDVEELTATVEATTEAVGEAQAALEEAQAAAEETPGAIEEANGALEEANGALEEAYAALDEACDAAMAEVDAALDEAAGAMHAAETPLQAELEAQAAALDELAATLAQRQQLVERAQANLAASEEVASKQEELDGLQEELAGLKEAFDESTVAVADGQIALDDAKTALAGFVAEPDEEGNVANADEEEGLKAAVEEAAAALEELKPPRDEAKQAYLDARAPVLALRGEIAQSSSAEEAQAQVEAATAAVEEAEAMHGEKEGELEALREQADSEQEALQSTIDEYDAAAVAAENLHCFMKIGNEQGDSSDSDSSSDSDDDSSSSSSSSDEEEQEEGAPPKAKKPSNKLKLKPGVALSLCFNNQAVSVGMASVKIKDSAARTGLEEYLRVVHADPGVMAFQNVHGYYLSASAYSSKVSVSKSLTEGAMFTTIPMGNQIALRSSFGGYLKAVVDQDPSSANILDGAWQVRWSSGDIAPLFVRGGSWELFGSAYQLDLSDPSNPSFTWPPTEEGGDPSGSQTTAIDEEALSKIQRPGFELSWTTEDDDTIVWRRISTVKTALGDLPCTGLVTAHPPPGFDDKESAIESSMLFNLVKRASKSNDPPISEMTKVSPKLPPAQLVFKKDSEQLNSGAEFIEEAWTNSSYVKAELPGYVKSIDTTASAEGSGSMKLCLYRIEGAIQQRTFQENEMVDIASEPGTQLRVLDAVLQGYEQLNVTRETQSIVVGNSMFIAGGAGSLLGDTEPGVDQTLTIKYASTRVLAIETVGKVTDDSADLEASFAAINNSPVCTMARKGDYLALIMASPPGQAFTCKEASVTMTFGSAKKFKNPNVEALPAFEVAAAPEPKEFAPADGYSVLSTLNVESNSAVVDHKNADLLASGEWGEFEEQAAENEETWPSVVKVDEAGTIRVSNDPEKAGCSFGIAIEPLLSRDLVVSCDVRTAGPLPVNTQVGFRVTPIAAGAALPFEGCINSWLPSVTSADRCHKEYKNRETVDIRSAGPGTTLAITSATLDGEDITEAVSALVEDFGPPGFPAGQRLFCPGGVYEKLELDPPRTHGTRGVKAPDSILVLQWVSWSHIEFQITRPPGQSAVTLCLDGVPYNTQVDVANLTIYELESLNDVDMPPLPKKDVFVNEATGKRWDADEYAAHLSTMSPADATLERCRIKAMVESSLKEIATHDARELREATKGLGTDDTALKKMLVSRASEDGPGSKHMQAIDSAFQRMFDITLAEMIASETSGDYKHFLTSLITPKAKLDAMAFDKAMRGIGTDDDLLIELVCTR
jgi:hypothetical protein